MRNTLAFDAMAKAVADRWTRRDVVRTLLSGVGAASGMWGMTRSNQVEAKGPTNRCLTPRECAEWCRSGRYTYDPTRNHSCMEACLNAQC
jgi:hypothetical protein